MLVRIKHHMQEELLQGRDILERATGGARFEL